MRCLESSFTEPTGVVHCSNDAVEVRLPCPAGRRDAVASYCDEHGGMPRARAEAERDWNYLAPAGVGGPADVEAAGCLCLQTPDAYVVLRHTPASQGGVWLAWLGLGSHLVAVTNPHAIRRSRGGRMARFKDRPATSFPTRHEALEQAHRAWQERVRTRLDEIQRARGGTLAWGSPVEPLEAPIVILLEQGDSRSAWDVAVTLPRATRFGVAGITGLRPSGECA